MADGRALEVDAIPALDSLPAIASPPGILGPRTVDSAVPTDALLLADARPFCVDLGHAAVVPSDDTASEQGKRRS